jgi:hypothetical protein
MLAFCKHSYVDQSKERTISTRIFRNNPLCSCAAARDEEKRRNYGISPCTAADAGFNPALSGGCGREKAGYRCVTHCLSSRVGAPALCRRRKNDAHAENDKRQERELKQLARVGVQREFEEAPPEEALRTVNRIAHWRSYRADGACKLCRRSWVIVEPHSVWGEKLLCKRCRYSSTISQRYAAYEKGSMNGRRNS